MVRKFFVFSMLFLLLVAPVILLAVFIEFRLLLLLPALLYASLFFNGHLSIEKHAVEFELKSERREPFEDMRV